MIRVMVMYPNEGKFDMDYYLNSHMPFARKLFSPFGLVKAEVDKGIGSSKPGEPAPFVAIASLIFKSMEEFQKAAEAHDAELAVDLPNFTEIRPVFQISEIMAE
jgi:uncharacterized protein (TIGR02118 family)